MQDKKETVITVQKVVEAGQDHILLLNSDKKLWITERNSGGSAGQPQFMLDDVFHVVFFKNSVTVLLESGDSLVADMDEIRRRLANKWNLSEAFRGQES
ncbi:MAG: hypothetical protein ACLFVQ_06495 [Chitinispirillaceae bacterium]